MDFFFLLVQETLPFDERRNIEPEIAQDAGVRVFILGEILIQFQ